MRILDAENAAAARIEECSMEIRKLQVREHRDTRGLYEEIFSEDSISFVDYYYTEKTKDNQIYVVEEDGGIQAMLHLNPYMLMVNGTEKEADYIVAVATRESYRKRGYMAALMNRALLDMYQRGRSFTFLMPAAEAIYLPHSFRTVYEQEHRYHRAGGTLPEGVRIYPAEEKDAAELAVTAEEYLSKNYQVYAKRSEAYYKRLIKEMASDGRNLILYRKGDRFADCRIWDMEEEEPHIKPKIMVRIVDVRRMLMSVRLKSLTAACFTVTDPVIKENNRCLTLTGTEFSGVMLMDADPKNSEGTITVGALSSFLFGAESAEELCLEEGVQLSVRLKEELKKLVPLSKIYLNEVV